MVRSTGLAGPAGAVTDPDRAVGTVEPDRGGDAAREVRRHAEGAAREAAGRRGGGETREAAGRGRAEDPVGDVVRRVRGALEEVFAAVAGTAADTADLLTGVSGSGRGPVAADLAELRPGLRARLGAHPLVSGVGFVAAPGLLTDVPGRLEWWQRGPGGAVRPLLLDLDPRHSAYSDYTHWDWYTLPRETGRRAVAGPYVDYLCSDEYSLTLSAPVDVGGRFAGVAAADVYLRHFEAAVLPVLQRLPAPARLVNARGRVAASTDPDHLAGSLTRGPDVAAVLAGPPAEHRADGLRLRPCGGTPLVLVTTDG
ncbi:MULTISPECIES: cache domain-containing protein [unclassified Streptomyces]|uniref:cache domain-containing protein n=1 Tax=unclassified Streptomyces TaxID=2593676 RepID=UPI0037F61110